MHSRERVFRAIRFEGPDRVPILHCVTGAALLKYGDKLERIFREYPSDFGDGYTQYENTATGRPQYEWVLSRKRRYVDEWGCVWFKIRRGLYGQVKEHPLADWKALETYRFPSLPDQKRGYVLGAGGTIFHRMIHLRGFTNLMRDLVTRPKEVYVLRDKIVDYNLQVIRRSLQSGVDGIRCADDWGTQERLMVKPSLWREFFKPAYKQMFDEIHKGGANVFFHSDGYIMDIIPDLIEIGVDVLNPQFSCMNLEELGKVCVGKVCILSDIDRQYTLPLGSVGEVRESVKRAIEIFGGHDGGLIAHGEIGPDVPLKNVRAMFRAFKKYGK